MRSDDKPLPIYGDGKQQRDWLHVEDNCRGILAVLEGGRIGEVYNIGGLDVVENLTMARRLLRVTGKPESLLSYVKDRPGHDRRYALDCDKDGTRNSAGSRRFSLEEGLRQTIDWYKIKSAWMAGVRGGEYLSYYEKYYENRDSSLHAIAPAGAATSTIAAPILKSHAAVCVGRHFDREGSYSLAANRNISSRRL